MSTPKHRRRGPVPPVPGPAGGWTVIASPEDVWEPVAGVPGYWISSTGRLAREVKVRTNKNGTRYARVSVKGVQKTIRL